MWTWSSGAGLEQAAPHGTAGSRAKRGNIPGIPSAVRHLVERLQKGNVF